MAGVVTAVLTDHELDRLIEWAAFLELNGELGGEPWCDEDAALYDKITAWRASLSCSSRQCQPGGVCDV